MRRERAIDERIAELAARQALRRFDRVALDRLIERWPRRPGVPALRQLLIEWDGRSAPARSVLEERFLALCRRAGSPHPDVNFRVEGFEVDFAWPSSRLIVEVDGYSFHCGPAASGGRWRVDGRIRRERAIDDYAAPMQRERAERIALIEAAFRIANERMSAWEEVDAEAEELFFCECSSLECRHKVPLTRSRYETVRSQPKWFLVVPGHEVPDLEEVVQRDDAHWIIEKPPLVADIVEGTDPRARQPGPERAEADGIADGIDER